MNRKQFIKSQGGTCANWTWSWSFINEEAEIIIFGVWDIYEDLGKTMIFSEEWKTNNKGRKQKGYDETKEHLRLIEEEGYILKVFKMEYSNIDPDDETSRAKIKSFDPVLYRKTLIKIDENYYAVN